MNKYISYFLLVMILISLISCDKQPEASDANDLRSDITTSSESLENTISTVESSSTDELQYMHGYLSYDFYNLMSPDDPFLIAMKDNNIDIIDYELFEQAINTTVEMKDAANKVLELWKDEMNYAIEQLFKDTSEEEQALFNESQTLWVEYVEKNMSYEKQLLVKYSTGSEFIFKSILGEARLYREQTIRIKYIHYMIEDNFRTEDEFNSLTFKNY